MTTADITRPTPASQQLLGEHYHLGFPVAYVQRGNGTTHLIAQDSHKALCGAVIYSTPGNRADIFISGTLTCTRCRQRTQKALAAAQNAKRAK